MLILTRALGEQLRIGDNIVVAVTAINGAQVSIGIEAPRALAVVREEVQARRLEVALLAQAAPGGAEPMPSGIAQ